MPRAKKPHSDLGRAWKPLREWYEGGSLRSASGPDPGAGAVEALADICVVRRALDIAEMRAVKTARMHGKSWAEIATRVGVSRQAAWERWRELDGPDAGSTASSAEGAAAAELIDSGARERRRQPTVVVPDVVGLSWDAARDAVLKAWLVPAAPNPDGPPLAALGWPHGVVTDQSPESGARVPKRSPVTLWIGRRDGGGEGGVREPRRPKPDPKSAREVQPEPDESAL
jgi:hypothetical protein